MSRWFTLLATLCVLACSPGAGVKNAHPSPALRMEGWKTYETSSYSIQYPPDWELDTSARMNTKFILFSPVPAAGVAFRCNINLLTESLAGLGVDLDQYAQSSEQQIRTQITHSVILVNKRLQGPTGEHHQMIFTGDQGIYQLKFEQNYWVSSNLAYVLTLTEDREKFSAIQPRADSILHTFYLK